MNEYDMIAIGSGSAMNIISTILERDQDMKVAVIDKDKPGGICLTRGCIPSKLLIHPANIVRTIEHAKKLGITSTYEIDFKFIMNRMREEIGEDIENIRYGLSESDNIDYYTDIAEFVDPYVLQVGETTITSEKILLCLGSKPYIPEIKNLDEVGYLTSKSFLELNKQPKSMIIIGGGYIAAEYGHFMSAMGTEVTIIGRNHQFLSGLEPEVSNLSKRKMSEYLDIKTGYEVTEVRKSDGVKTVIARNIDNGDIIENECEEILIAAGRVSNSHLLQPEKGGIETDEEGWIKVNNKMETSKKGVFAFGDAIGKHLFKHVANKESIIALYNILGHEREMNYDVIPAAVFSYPEIAYVGMTQEEALSKYNEEDLMIGFQLYENTAKGNSMAVKDYFVKVILHQENRNILGCHIIGPQASNLIQEVIDLMNTPGKTPDPINAGMHIHPALSEVVERAFSGFMGIKHYQHVLKDFGLN